MFKQFTLLFLPFSLSLSPEMDFVFAFILRWSFHMHYVLAIHMPILVSLVHINE